MKITLKRVVEKGLSFWQVRCWKNGRYERKQFVRREDAQAYRDQLEGQASEAKQLEVPDVERHSVWTAYERARKAGYTLTQACDSHEKQLRAKVVKITASDAVAFFMGIKVAKRLRVRSLENLKYRLGRFVSVVKPETTLDAVTLSDLHRCLDRKWSPRSVINFRLAMVNFFAWALKQKHVLENVAENIEKPLTENLPPVILTPREVREFLDRTQSIHPELIPYVSISLFAGLRNKEVSLMEWETSRRRPSRSERTRQRPVNAGRWISNPIYERGWISVETFPSAALGSGG